MNELGTRGPIEIFPLHCLRVAFKLALRNDSKKRQFPLEILLTPISKAHFANVISNLSLWPAARFLSASSSAQRSMCAFFGNTHVLLIALADD